MPALPYLTAFFFALCFTVSRRWSLAAALAYGFLSPSYGLFPALEQDRGIVHLPWRVQVLAKYGEGPHNTALALIPLWRSARSSYGCCSAGWAARPISAS